MDALREEGEDGEPGKADGRPARRRAEPGHQRHRVPRVVLPHLGQDQRQPGNEARVERRARPDENGSRGHGESGPFQERGTIEGSGSQEEGIHLHRVVEKSRQREREGRDGDGEKEHSDGDLHLVGALQRRASAEHQHGGGEAPGHVVQGAEMKQHRHPEGEERRGPEARGEERVAEEQRQHDRGVVETL